MFSPTGILFNRWLFTRTLVNFSRTVFSYEKLPHLSLGPPAINRSYQSDVAHIKAHEEDLAYHLRCNALLFFLILVLYHNQQRMVSIAPTDMQFGIGSKKRKEEAAHSTIIPSLRDCAPNKESITKFNESLLRQTPHFYHDNNMTVCLPTIVNQKIDRRIEREIRVKSVAIINFVSLKKLCPTKAIHIYLAILRQAMKKLTSELNKRRKTDQVQAQLLALENQRKGLYGINKHFIDQLLGRKRGESIKAALERVQRELLIGDAYRNRMTSVLLSRSDNVFVSNRGL